MRRKSGNGNGVFRNEPNTQIARESKVLTIVCRSACILVRYIEFSQTCTLGRERLGEIFDNRLKTKEIQTLDGF